MDNKSFVVKAKKLFDYFVNKVLPSKLRTEISSVTVGENRVESGVRILIDAVREGQTLEIPYYTPSEKIKGEIAGLQAEAQQGCSEAQHRLGTLYLVGVGVLSDFDKAQSYLEQSAKAGNSESVYWLAGMYLDGFGAEQNISKGLELLGVACSQGNAGAMTRYANIYKDGLFGVEKDLKAAERYLSRAVEVDDDSIIRQVDLELLREQMVQEGVVPEGAGQTDKAFNSFFESNGYADCGGAGLQSKAVGQNTEQGYIKL